MNRWRRKWRKWWESCYPYRMRWKLRFEEPGVVLSIRLNPNYKRDNCARSLSWELVYHRTGCSQTFLIYHDSFYHASFTWSIGYHAICLLIAALADSAERGRCCNLNQRGITDDIRRVQLGSIWGAMVAKYFATFTAMMPSIEEVESTSTITTLLNGFISFPSWVQLLWARRRSRAQGFLWSLMSWHAKIGCLGEMRSQINRHTGCSCAT